jgi:malate dehydrogenase
MTTVAILGSGDLAATLARRVAERELARRIVMVDVNDGRARGKALDLAQSAPVEGYDVSIEGCAELSQAGRFDVLMVADPPALDEPASSQRAAEFMGALARESAGATVVVAGVHGAVLVEAAVRAGLARDRVLGSSPVALASVLRYALARELETGARTVDATVLGMPGHLVLPQGAATVGGIPVERLSSTAGRRALAAANARIPGPVALAAAAAALLSALRSARISVLPVTAVLMGEYGQRGVAMAVPARVGNGRLQGILEPALEPVDRIAFDNAAGRRHLPLGPK